MEPVERLCPHDHHVEREISVGVAREEAVAMGPDGERGNHG
jgi:hypothetical protein